VKIRRLPIAIQRINQEVSKIKERRKEKRMVPRRRSNSVIYYYPYTTPSKRKEG